MACENCYNVEISECPESIKLNANLDADTDYLVTITDKFGKRYIFEVTSDGQGSLTIDLDTIPLGTFNRHAGTFIIEVFLDDINCEPELLQFCCDGILSDYDCIAMSFYQSDLEVVETEIGCDCPE